MFNLPMCLTWLRIIAIPFLVALYYLPVGWLSPMARDLSATAIFILACVTDWADGYLARRFNQTSAFGAFLDPVADKLIVAVALIILVDFERVNAVVAAIIIGREITISALREWMAKIGAAKNVAVSMLGKIKTTAQMIAIILLLFHDHMPVPIIGPFVTGLTGWDTHFVGTMLIWLAALLTLWSMGYYLHKAAPEFRKERKKF
ncbi:MAG: CDP-diacylglycerol--glycerol-3-phosphate 3-phosphatidyltransferase [Zoogloeaceae bacterium]|jgi:CDP-diacylglycerol--glycerol-3-phosphate 3-phosphatidyltransferase/cardiolipin synthase|nr:CDP-diacylglycerol--glycerol-3-phosphate 3-phosphatidyltransferase [Zoogloeaceae bacterium]